MELGGGGWGGEVVREGGWGWGGGGGGGVCVCVSESDLQSE